MRAAEPRLPHFVHLVSEKVRERCLPHLSIYTCSRWESWPLGHENKMAEIGILDSAPPQGKTLELSPVVRVKVREM